MTVSAFADVDDAFLPRGVRWPMLAVLAAVLTTAFAIWLCP